MSQYPPPGDPYQQSGGIYYASPAPGDPGKLVNLAVVFNYISAGLDGILVLFGTGLGILFLAVPDLSTQQNPGDPPQWVIGAIYLGLGLFGLIFGLFKVIGTRKLQRGGSSAWGWGLAAGILGAAQLFCGSCFCLQPAAGIYTIVILCKQNVRDHLANLQQSQIPPGAA